MLSMGSIKLFYLCIHCTVGAVKRFAMRSISLFSIDSLSSEMNTECCCESDKSGSAVSKSTGHVSMKIENVISFHLQVMMNFKLLRILLFSLMVVVGLSVPTVGQNIGCSDITKTQSELLQINSFRGAPGDTVLMPYFLDSDSLAVGFRFLLRFDTTKLKVVKFLADTVFYDIVPAGRLAAKLQYSALLATQWEDRRDIVSCFLSPALIDTAGGVWPDTLPAGEGIVFFLRFVANASLQHGDTSRLFLYESDICFPDPLNPLDSICVDGCEGGELSEVWNSTFLGGLIDQPSYPRFSGLPGIFTADTLPPKPVVTFAAAPDSISAGESSTLSWDVLNGDSLDIINTTSGGSILPTKTLLTGTLTVSPTQTTTYRLIAWLGLLADTVTARVAVGGVAASDAPVITLNPSAFSYSLNQGETVSFSATATDPNTGDNVTLSASVSPTSVNSTFSPNNPVAGVTVVTMNYSLTPDFTQSGIFVVTFTATDGTNAALPVSVTITINALQQDRLFSTSAPGQKPVGGLRGANEVLFPINLVTSKTVYGVQFDMRYPFQLIRVDSILPSGRIPDYTIFDNIGDTPGNIRVLAFGLNSEPVGTDSSTAVLYVAMSIDSTSTPWTSHTIFLEDGRESVDPDPAVSSLPLVTDFGIIEVDNPGDVNLDRNIDVGDIVNIVAYIVNNFPLSRRQFATADVIINDLVNVFDLMADINLIFDIPINPSPPPPAGEAIVELNFADLLAGTSDYLTVSTSETPAEVAGVQLELVYDPTAVVLGVPTTTSYNNNFILNYRDDGNGRMKMILYHTKPFLTEELIQLGPAELVEIPITAKKDLLKGDRSMIRLSEAMLSTPKGASIRVSGVEPTLPISFTLKQNYPNPFNPLTTIEFTIGTSGGNSLRQVKLEIYNVLGQHVGMLKDEPMLPGAYQVVWDATNTRGERVASGVYLYRLSIGDEQKTRKMLLLK